MSKLSKEEIYAQLVRFAESYKNYFDEYLERFNVVRYCIDKYGECNDLHYELINKLWYDGFIVK